ncbi:DUF2914 domain-containing protein [Hydrogenothermus marinus]|uniref:DUF2914 domain-containing protein n=1 Tax=Hydrogenothermus marinus TaxID=133270 RepID=A0A3M0BKE6_9AQUI|nr:DUF2914 domain-containing protein [Hydrogenothermus marinus]RMA97830.1 Protein of unknown function (DUF2914) [Hydrogenothermus marinus]
MVLRLTAFLLAILFSLNISFAEEKKILAEVLEIKFATKIENREPINIYDEFPKDIKKIYCWTKIKAYQIPTFVIHEWYYNNRLMASVKLPITYYIFRTWSSKRILPIWTGKWKVIVKDERGNIIAEKEFFIKEK